MRFFRRNPLQIDPDFEKSILYAIRRREWSIDFYVLCDGILTEHKPSEHFWKISRIELRPFNYTLLVHYLDPTSIVFSDVIEYFSKFYPNIYEWDVEIFCKACHQLPAKYGQYSRTVKYWMEQPRSDLGLNKLPKYLYHGTASELWYEGINIGGLKPRILGHTGAFGSYGAGGALSLEDRIYLSVHPDAAAREASYQAAQAHGGFPTILKIDTNYLDLNLFEPDEDADVDGLAKIYQSLGCSIPSLTTLSLRVMGTCAYRGSIPSEAIEPYIRCTSKRQSDRSLRWIRWDNPPRTLHPISESLLEPWFNPALPVRLALYNAGIIDMDGKLLIDDVTDKKIRNILRNANWASLAACLIKELSGPGLKGIKELSYLPANVAEPDIQLVINLLIKYGIYSADRDVYKRYNEELDEIFEVEKIYISYTSWWSSRTDQVIALAKELVRHNISYEELFDIISRYKEKYAGYV
jgi:hypothetical protein